MTGTRSAPALYVLTGALLLFSLEPLVGRLLLPAFGGGFQVWTTSLMFFQGALVLAYAYAHGIAGRLGPWHLGLLAIAALWLPPSTGTPGGEGVGDLLLILLRHVAVPFVALASASVVAQRWVGARGEAPFGLYAVSNAGSLLALLLYALWIGRTLELATQRLLWTVGFGLHLALAAWTVVALRPEPERAGVERGARPSVRLAIAWLALSAAPSAFLMAVTNLMALEVGNLPVVWALPLALYLGSFVWAFADPEPGRRTRVPRLLRRLWPHVAAVGLLFFLEARAAGALGLGVHLTVLGVVSLAAHGELYVLRPPPGQLTRFYLAVALGGWIGGATVALLAPVAFGGLWEYPLALATLTVTVGVLRRRALLAWVRGEPRGPLLVTVALAVALGVMIADPGGSGAPVETLETRRSFYGVYRVLRRAGDGGLVRELVSGNTRHGLQREGDGAPLSYYHRAGPLGDVMATLEPARTAAVGLGVGASAAYVGPGRRLRAFEIDPAVVDLARRHFSYLARAGDAVEVVVGDARLRLEDEDAAGEALYDLVFIDAFTGDAIPTHLLTREALELYGRRGRGPLLVHVSNRYLDLRPVLRRLADALALDGVTRSRHAGLAGGEDPSRYVLLAPPGHPALAALLARGWSPLADVPPARTLWTDGRVDPLEVFEL